MRRLLLLALLMACPVHADTKVTLLHVSDYHSHALPFYTDEGVRGGIARAIGYLRQEKRRGALVFNGGDTINKGAPAWSDRYGCAEWRWFNGVVDAMAFGNHDADYGMEAFSACRGGIRYPVLSANARGFAPYAVFTVRGHRIGVFAVAGSDFQRLVNVPGLTFGDPVAAAREAVRQLRGKERVHAVVMIGHQHAEADYELARTVPGIDVIFGTHSHLKRDLTRIPGTSTWFISPSQYLTFISRVTLAFDGGALTAVEGRLVPVDDSLPEDRRIARRVRRMQRDLERDPEYRALFTPITTLDEPLSVRELADLALRTMLRATGADVALSTVSSFRRPLGAGSLTLESLRGALPYDNEIVVCTMTGSQLARVLESSRSRAGSDSEAWVAGTTVIAADATARVATTDYLAGVAYRDLFDCKVENTGLRVRAEVRKGLAIP